MPYPEMMVAPLRADLRNIGFQELTTPDEVDAVLGGEKRTTLLENYNTLILSDRRDYGSMALTFLEKADDAPDT